MWIHHLTHIENLKSILENGLKPRNELKQNEFKNTANNEIITKREEYKSNNNNIEMKSLNNYIPFHINKLQITYRIPYNYIVCKNEGNENMIFLSCKTKNLFSDEIIYQLYHPVSNYKCEYVGNNEKEFIKKLEEGYDFIQGSRYIKGGKAINTPLIRHLSVNLIHAPIISLTAKKRFTDTTNAFRAYSARYLKDERVKPLREIFMTYELLAYLSVRATQLGYKACEIPVTREYPKTGKTPTKISFFKGNSDLMKILFKNLFGKYNPK